MVTDRRPGTYALVLSSVRDCEIEVGKLGCLRVRPGFYIYAGSAFGPGGVRARVDRHLREAKVAHWHIDYLRVTTAIEEAWVSYESRGCEHLWAEVLGELEGATLPQRGFGSSDCGCVSHLSYFATRPSRDGFQERLHVLCADRGLDERLASVTSVSFASKTASGLALRPAVRPGERP